MRRLRSATQTAKGRASRKTEKSRFVKPTASGRPRLFCLLIRAVLSAREVLSFRRESLRLYSAQPQNCATLCAKNSSISSICQDGRASKIRPEVDYGPVNWYHVVSTNRDRNALST